MDFKYFLYIFAILILSISVSAVNQNVTVNILTVPTIFLGDHKGGNDTIDTDGTVFATLGNNQADQCQINWGASFQNINPNITSTNNTYYELGNKTVFYRCKADAQNYTTVNDTIDVIRVPPLTSIIEPNKACYGNRRVLLDLLINKKLVDLDFQVNNKRAERLCSHCDKFNKTRNFNDGYFNISFIAIDNFKVIDRKNVTFCIDATKPRIIDTLPKNRENTNGSFLIKYDEDFLQNVTLYYNGSGFNNKLTKFDCPSGKKKTCEFNVDLSGFNNKILNYHFEISDLFNRVVQKKPVSVKIDTIVPEFIKLNLTVNKKIVTFDINISEKVDLSYIDKNETKPKLVSLCKNCNFYKSKRSFKTGMHSLIFMATDKALNTKEEMVNFTI